MSSFHDLRCQLFRSHSAVKTLDKFIEATRSHHIHRSHARLTHIYAHRIASHRPPTPPMTDFTLSPSKYRQDQEGQYSGCPGVQAKLPTKFTFTFPRMHKIPIAHTQSIKYSCINPGTCNTTYKARLLLSSSPPEQHPPAILFTFVPSGPTLYDRETGMKILKRQSRPTPTPTLTMHQHNTGTTHFIHIHNTPLDTYANAKEQENTPVPASPLPLAQRPNPS
ncbi:hypothetical protein CF327_g7559 [Tilletia walkeri]|nr:hypothetical protein CF327_g7559 [Tilletia walkeri]